MISSLNNFLFYLKIGGIERLNFYRPLMEFILPDLKCIHNFYKAYNFQSDVAQNNVLSDSSSQNLAALAWQ